MNLETTNFRNLNRVKANFDSIYTAPDPREYYRVLCGLDYVIPDLAKPVFRALIDAQRYALSRPLKVLDIGCSYGINAALARHPLDIRRLAQRYTSDEMRALDPAALVALDRHYFASWPSATDARFVGLDSSQPAVNYALQAGLLDGAVSTDLEHIDPSSRDAEVLGDLDLIVSTGCVGYVTERTFRRVLDRQSRMPWIANFVLRMFPYDPIERTLGEYGYVTEKFSGVTFVQRRFRSREEAAATIDQLEAKGIDVTAKETEGLLHAELYLSRPAAAVEQAPLGKIVSVTSGASRRFGRRFARSRGGEIDLVH
ncbi:MAG: class I SAM-dependent methyltransferase [Proteobacteria bacterium]|nr:class I SAM-dependent methyltransferase [Pseudomonadota bacterium]